MEDYVVAETRDIGSHEVGVKVAQFLNYRFAIIQADGNITKLVPGLMNPETQEYNFFRLKYCRERMRKCQTE